MSTGISGPGQGLEKFSTHDRDLIRLLQEDGRISAAELARRVGMSERTVRARLAALRSAQVIEITTVADPVLLGYNALCMLAVEVDAPRPLEQVASDLAELSAVDYVVIVAGRTPILAELVCRDHAELLQVLDREVRAIRGVRSVECFPYLRLRYQEPMWDSATRPGAGDGRGIRGGRIELDQVDRDLLAALSLDGRMPYRELAERAHVSETQARARVSRLTRSGAVRVMALTKPRSVGYDAMAWLAVRCTSQKRVGELADRLASLGAIAYLATCAGRHDILAEAVLTDAADLDRLLDEEIRPMAAVAQVEASLVLDLYYERVPPPW